jgi:sugar porter (SP) family MFS transporter
MGAGEFVDVEDMAREGQTVMDLVPKLDKPWFRYGHLLKLNMLMFAPILTQITSGYDGSMMNGLQSIENWQDYFGHPQGHRLGTMSNGLIIGALITTPFLSYLIEYLGRKKPVIIGSMIMVLGAGLQAGSRNFSMFLGSRIILGIGNTITSASAAVYLTECGYPTHRPTLTSIYQCGWPMGSFVAALVTWGPYNSPTMVKSTWSWRLPSLLQGLFPLIVCVLMVFGPESPRWLISKGRHEQALNFFTKYQGAGDPTSALVQFQMAEISATLEAEKSQKMSRWAEWWSTKAMLHRLFITIALPMFIQLCGNAIISYYLHLILNSIGITDAITQLKLNLGINAFGLAWDMVFANLVYKLRRKLLLMGGFGSCCVCFTIFTVLAAINTQRNFEDKSLGYGGVVMIFAFQGVYHIASPVIPTYVMEIAPFSLRAKAAVIRELATSAVSFFNNYVNPVAMKAIDWKYYIVYDVWLVVQITIVYFFFPETYKMGLEEIARVFGDELIRGNDTAEKHKQLNLLPSEKDETTVHIEKV